jgi:predicted metal-dependent hydrolase
MFDKEELLKLIGGVRLFNQKKYWECHEEVEDLWLEEASPVRNIYWAIIQIATSLYHYHGDNHVGAIDMMYKAKDKVIAAEKAHVESQILYKFLSWKKLKNVILKLQSNNELEVVEEFTKFRFPDPDKWRMHFD